MIIYEKTKPVEFTNGNNVGTVGEHNSYKAEFLIRGMSDEDIDYSIYLRFANGQLNTVLPDEAEITDEGTHIVWNIKKDDIFAHGYFELQLEGRKNGALIFQTRIVTLYADDSIPIEDERFSNPNSATLQMRDETYAILDKIKEQKDAMAENAELIKNSNVTAKADKSYVDEQLALKADSTDLNLLFKQTELTLHEDQYIYSTGKVSNQTPFVYSDPVTVPAGYKVRLKAAGYQTNVAMISEYTDGTYTPVVISTDDQVRNYQYQTEAETKLVFSFNGSMDNELVICCDINKAAEKLNTLDGRFNMSLDDLTATRGKGINVNGYLSTLPSFAYTSPVFIPAGYDISLIGAGVENVAMIAIYNSENNYTTVVASDTDAEVKEYTCRTAKDAYYAFSYNATKSHSLSVKVNLSGVTNSIAKLNDKVAPYSSVSLFKSIGVVGDSYATGQLWSTADTHYNNRLRSWGEILARRNGADCVTYSAGGLTTRSWLTSSYGLSLLESSDPNELYLLALGINDAGTLGTDYLGTIDDADEARNDAANPDTFYGNYAKIIARIQDHAPRAKIVLMTLHEKNDTHKSFNEAIIALAGYLNTAYIVQDDDPFFASGFYNNNMSQGHPRAVIYSGMAAAIERLLEKCMVNQFDYFQDAFMYSDSASGDKIPDGAVTEAKLSTELQDKINSVVNSLEAIENGTY